MKKNKKEAGEFSLIFTANALKFVEMEVKNDMNEITRVSFITSQFDSPIDNKLFVIKSKNLPR